MIDKFFCWMGWVKFVWLQDGDGEVTLATYKKGPWGKGLALRHNKWVVLNDDGTVGTAISGYVKSWKPYEGNRSEI